MNESDLRLFLVTWLDRERSRLWERAVASGVPARVVVDVPVARQGLASQGAWSSGERKRPVSSFAVPALRSRIGAIVVDSDPAADAMITALGDDCARSEHSETSNLSGGLTGVASPVPTWQSEPRRWLRHAFIEKLAQHYFLSLPSIDVGDATLATRIVDEMVGFIREAEWQVLTRIPFAMRSSVKSLVDDDVSIRSTTPEEAGPFLASLSPSEAELGFDRLDLARLQMPATHVLEVRSRGPKALPFQPAAVAREVIRAMQILGHDPTGDFVELTSAQPRWLGFRLWGTQVPMRFTAIPKEITEADAHRAIALARQLSLCKSQPIQVAVHSFTQGVAQTSPAESIVDFVTCLEGLLLSGIAQELSFRFSLNGALLLATAVEERHEVRTQLKQLYECRSKIVHGGGLPKNLDVHLVARSARELAAKALRHVLQNGVPSSDHFVDLAFR